MSHPFQASAVAITGPHGARALLIIGPPGSGKSSLALALIDRGAALVGDDGVLLEQRDRTLWALPPPRIAGLLEIRNVGLVSLPAAPAPVALVIALDPAAPRLPDAPQRTVLAEVEVPLVRLYPDSWALPLRAEWALHVHGALPPCGTA